METTEAKVALAAVSLFAGLESQDLARVARVAVRRRYEAGEAVFLEGEPCTGLHVVETGWLKSTKSSPAGREQTVRLAGPGEVFNVAGVLTDIGNQATVTAMEAATVWVIARTPLIGILEAHAALSLAFARDLSRRLVHLMNLVENLSLRPVAARLARILLDQSKDNLVERRRWSTQAELAAMLGTVPDVVHRALRALSREGLIRVTRRQISILDHGGLESRSMPGDPGEAQSDGSLRE